MAQQKGRGAPSNLQGRFERLVREECMDQEAMETLPSLKTTVGFIQAKSILAYNQSPDIPFDRSINPYQGCEHGCTYCYARPSHAYLELSPGLDFETKLFAKINAAALLRKTLSAPGYQPQVIALGANTDPYQPIEKELKITRQLIEVMAEYNHPFAIVSKNALVERDLDLLAPIAQKRLAHVFISVTNLDHVLASRLEPRASSPTRRLETIARLTEAGVPTGVMVAPVIPLLTDCFMEEILERAKEAGAIMAGYTVLRLPNEVAPLFQEWLNAHYPLKAKHVMSLVRQIHGGKIYDTAFGIRHQGSGIFANLFAQRFKRTCEKLGLNKEIPALVTNAFCIPDKALQLNLF